VDAPATDPPVVVAVGAVIYQIDARAKLSILLIKKRGGYWTLPKGKLLPDESEPQALAREVHEETGLCGEIGPAVRSVSYMIVKRGQEVRKQVTYYLVRAEPGELRLSASEQIVKAGWYAPAAALRRLRRGRLRVILRRACEMLAS
jgi:8-oxo-dGTP pyrophosphatase MutT (NUDIX family)